MFTSPRTIVLGALISGAVALVVLGSEPQSVHTVTFAQTIPEMSSSTFPPETPPTQPTQPTPEGPTQTTTEVPVVSVPVTNTIAPGSNYATLAPVCGPVDGVGPGGAGCRIIAFYGNPLSNKMGVLGASPKAAMLADLAAQTKMWQTADPTTPTKCGLEVIAITAQGSPGPGNLYRARLAAKTINQMLAWAREAGCVLILDIQVGASNVPTELTYLARWLGEPDVQVALDPEWDMPPGVVPGSKIGSMTAADIQYTIDVLSAIVKTRALPPKLLIVHRFRDFMVTNPEILKPTAEIRLLVNADGFGPPASKLSTYVVAKKGMPTQLTGFKLFFRNDKPMLQPKDVLPLKPTPVFINYQ